MVTADIPLPGTPARVRAAQVLRSVFGAVTVALGKAVTPHKAALGNLASIPLTVAGAGCVCFAAFHVAHGWGWLVTGVTLVILEHLIADEP